MLVSEKYPKQSKYLTVEDLQGRELHVVNDHLEEDVVMGMPKVEKDVLHFVGMEKPLVLSPSNARTLAQALGNNSDGWGGAHVELCVEDGTIPWIKIRVVPSKPTKQNGKPYDEAVYDESNPPPHTAEDLDNIPF